MRKFAIAFLIILLPLSIQAQRFTVRGTVEDIQTGEKLISANVYESISLKGIATNAFGFYSLTLPAGEVKLNFSFIGYKTVIVDLKLSRDTLINIRLEPVISLGEVIISADKAKSAVRSRCLLQWSR